MSVAFTREESAETAAEVELPDRPISPHPNLVTASGQEALTNAMRESRAAYDAAQRIEDAERRRAVAVASRDMRYFAERLRTISLAALPIRARATGETYDIDPFRGSASSSPTILKAWRRPSPRLNVTRCPNATAPKSAGGVTS
jgi:hypothetical protein